MSPEATISQISTVLGVSWASGINLYATILVMGGMHASGAVVLPEGIDYVAHPLVLIAAGIMFIVEFFADKIPGIDSAWDGVHTFVRIPAGVAMAYGAAEGMGPVLEMTSALLGGSLATMSHSTKAGARLLINTSPEPVTNWTASVTEDVVAVGGMWTALTYPWLFLCLLGLIVLLTIWLRKKIWRGIKKVFGFLKLPFKKEKEDIEPEPPIKEKAASIEEENTSGLEERNANDAG